MSTRTRRGAQATESNETATQAPEAAVTETEQVPADQSAVNPTTEATPEPPLDLGPFQAAVAESAATADPSTGMLPEDSLKRPNEEYAKLHGSKAKGAAKRWLGERMQELLMAGVSDPDKVNEARAYMQVQNGLSAGKTGGGGSEPKAPSDPTADFVAQVATLRLASELLSGQVPEGVKEDWSEQADAKSASLQEQVSAYRAWLATEVPEGTEKPAAPETDAIVTRAFRLSQGKAPGRKSAGTGTRHEGPSRSVEAHIASYSADKPEGHFAKIAEIAGHNSDEYGTDHPSSGAVTAALFDRDGNAKVKGGMKGTTQDGKRGAVKVAA